MRSPYATKGPMAAGVPTNNQRGRGSGLSPLRWKFYIYVTMTILYSHVEVPHLSTDFVIHIYQSETLKSKL